MDTLRVDVQWTSNEENRKAGGQERMGGWAVAQSPILGTTIKVGLLKRKGYVSMIDYYSKFRVSI